MVLDGHAMAYRQYSERYADDEDAARAAQRGIWGTVFERPSDWRRSH